MHSILLFVIAVFLTFSHISAQNLPSSCTTTKYPGVQFKGNNILGDDKHLLSYSFDDCVHKCLDRPTCKAINYLELDISCYVLSAGIVNMTSTNKLAYFQSDRSIHAYVTCSTPPTPPPTSPPKPPKTVGCGKQSSAYPPRLQQYNRVIGGIEAKAHSWPWLVRYSVDLSDALNDFIFGCGSTLLRIRPNLERSDILLTAAHCVTQLGTMETNPQPHNVSKITVLAGNHNRFEPENDTESRNVAQLRFHPDFLITPDKGPLNDIALVKLQSPIKFTEKIRPVCLPSLGDAMPIGKLCVSAGWGRVNNQTVDKPFTLQQVISPVHNAKTCKGEGERSWGDMYQEDKKLCAGTLLGTSGTCEGDSGGTLACQLADSSWKIYGITSFGVLPHCVEAGLPAIYTRVSTYVDWINKNMKEMTSV